MAGKEESDENLEAGSTASAGAFTGKEFSLKLTREDIAGKQESSLKLCPAESMKLLPGEEECSLRLCPTKRKAPTAGYLPPLKGGAIKSKGEDYCSEGDIASTDAVLSEDVDKGTNATVLADVTMVEIEEQAISDTKVAAATQKGAPGTGFSEVGKYGDPKVQSHKTMGEEDENEEEDGDEEDGEDEEDEDEDEEEEEEDEDEDEEDEETKGTAPHATVVLGGVKYSYQVKDYSSEDSEVEDDWDVHTEGEYFDDSEAEYQVVVEKANAKLNRFMERLRARTKTSVSKDDFGDHDDEEVCA